MNVAYPLESIKSCITDGIRCAMHDVPRELWKAFLITRTSESILSRMVGAHLVYPLLTSIRYFAHHHLSYAYPLMSIFQIKAKLGSVVLS
jgi:hypothetical protein